MSSNDVYNLVRGKGFAHNLRTQLGIVLLELGMVSDPRARNIENNINEMIGTVKRIFGLARL